jgi:hypothetical protein
MLPPCWDFAFKETSARATIPQALQPYTATTNRQRGRGKQDQSKPEAIEQGLSAFGLSISVLVSPNLLPNGSRRFKACLILLPFLLRNHGW